MHVVFTSNNIYKVPLSSRTMMKVMLALAVIVFMTAAVSATSICADNQVLFRLLKSNNSHVANASDINYPYKICYDQIMSETYPSSNPWECTGANTVLRVSAGTNAHVEEPYPQNSTPGYRPICFGDLGCRLIDSRVNGQCAATEQPVIRLSSRTNAHIAIATFTEYPYILCCSPGAGGNVLLRSANWRHPLTDAILTRARIGDTFNLTVRTGLPAETIVLLNIYENDSIIGSPSNRDEIKSNIPVLVGSDGVVRYQWSLTQEDFDKGTNAPFYDLSTIELVFNASAGGEDIDSNELSVDKRDGVSTTSWMCSSDRKAAARLLDSNRIETQTLSNEASDTTLAGSACKGPNGETGTIDDSGLSTSRDDCCPTNYRCTSRGCVIGAADSCDDYKTREECKFDSDNVWNTTLTFISTGMCEDIVKQHACSWNGTMCGYRVQDIDSITGAELGSCTYFYDDSQQCSEGQFKELEVTAHAEGQVCGQCASNTYQVPCGRPAFELPFFGTLQFILAIIGIMGVYLLKTSKNPKVLYRTALKTLKRH